MAKQFGLIKSEKKQVIIRPSIFNESSDSDDNNDKPTGIQDLKKKEKRVQDKILAEDPTVYQYDELYDEMQSKRIESKLARKDLDKKPKYISKLLETAERRKKENERRIERQVQKEREEEGDTFKDKESFVTSAYRKKLEEMKELEEKEKREEYLESIGDVKKQGDLSGFYRHLYAQQVNYDEEQEKQEKIDKDKCPKDEQEAVTSDISKSKGSNHKRKYRKRESSGSSDEPEKQIKLEHLPSNLDADSDFSIDSDSDSESEPKKPKAEPIDVICEIKEQINVNIEKNDEVKREEHPVEKENDVKDVEGTVKTETEIPKKPKKDIWKKRTVDTIYEDALKKYYERKSSREEKGVFL